MDGKPSRAVGAVSQILGRAAAADASAKTKGQRLANKFLMTLQKKAKKTKLRETRKEVEGDNDNVGPLKVALLSGISSKVSNLSTKIKKMQMDVKRQLYSMQVSQQQALQGHHTTPRPDQEAGGAEAKPQDPFGLEYERMLRLQRQKLKDKQLKARLEQAKANKKNRAKILQRNLEKRARASRSPKVRGAGSHGNSAKTGHQALSGDDGISARAARAKALQEEYDFAKENLQRKTMREGLKRHIARVDFAFDEVPFELPAIDLLRLIVREINFKDEKERVLLKKYLESDENQALLTACFWYVYLTFFETRYRHLQQQFLKSISENYMRMLDMYGRGPSGTKLKKLRTLLPQPSELFAIAQNMTRSHDAFFKLCPLVCGMGICYGLHYMFPTSRHQYDRELMLLILEEVFLVQTGIYFTRASLESMIDVGPSKSLSRCAAPWHNKKLPRRPRGEADLSLPPILPVPRTDVNAPPVSTDPFKGLGERVLAAREDRAVQLYEDSEDGSSPVPSPKRKSASPKRSRVRSAIASPKRKSVLPPPLSLKNAIGGAAQLPTPSFEENLDKPIARQPREEFTATMVSPIGKMYLRERGRTKNGGRTGFVYRTILDDRCPYGGSDNLERHSQHTLIEAQSQESQQVYKAYHMIQEHFKDKGEQEKFRSMKEIRQLDGLKGLVLHRGTKYLRHFSLDMVTRRQKNKTRAQDRDTDGTTSTLYYDDPYLQKTSALRGLKRGVTHKIERLLHVGNAMGADIGHPRQAGAHKEKST